jgi:hypothetical protein
LIKPPSRSRRSFQLDFKATLFAAVEISEEWAARRFLRALIARTEPNVRIYPLETLPPPMLGSSGGIGWAIFALVSPRKKIPP